MIEQEIPGHGPVENANTDAAGLEPGERVIEHRYRLALLAGDLEECVAEDHGLTAAAPVPIGVPSVCTRRKSKLKSMIRRPANT